MPLQHEIAKRKPFDSPAEEVHLSVIRTASFMDAAAARFLKPLKLTPASYNVLRILRGAAMAPDQPTCDDDSASRRESRKGELTSSTIGQQMVTIVPDVTRLVDRLERLGLVARRRCEQDRRVVYVHITSAGLSLLSKIDGPLCQIIESQLNELSQAEFATLLKLLEKVRAVVIRDQVTPIKGE